MTIAVCVKVRDGLVLATDSASTLAATDSGGNAVVVNVYNNAQKIVNLIHGSPIGFMTWGLGSIGVSSVSTLAKDLRARFISEKSASSTASTKDPAAYSIEDVAEKAAEFIYGKHYEPHFRSASGPKPPLGFLVSGYSPNADAPEEWLVEIDADGILNGPTLVAAGEVSGVVWFGQPEVIGRIIYGFGSGLGQVLTDFGVANADIQPAMGLIRDRLGVNLAEAAMPIQDAVDLAEFLAHSAIMYARFMPGANTVGGPIAIAAITKHEGFKWVRREFFYDARFNPRRDGEDHV